ncbi:hypothetical protein SAMN04488029_2473 [Reichenbachiella faecimaris]|uniref:DUF4252 domain-containing protein n=1 Tax=Reichenbachiella faecimaris TaxID=692418 RepID=A0A1W2GFE1_REIFA|nr:hypothetical protein [Reichenbachiella faecimaris]SMD35363.1 hypothetical protein SAMN04488029_2473 [Reichenbachiella faecimaris]
MKNIIIIVILTYLFGTTCMCQNINDQELIQSFLNEITSNQDITLEEFSKKGIFASSINQEVEAQQERESLFSLLAQSVQDEINGCKSLDDRVEILTLEESKRLKSFDEDLEIPDKGKVYILFCGNSVITRMLIIDNKIAAISTLNKSGKLFFALL